MPGLCLGSIIVVDASATGNNDGSNWADAYTQLQSALAVASSGDEIRVAKGVYKPAGISGDRTATFQLLNGVTIKGGYAGSSSPDPNTRDIDAYETILSGDLNGDDDANSANNSENSYHIVTGGGTDATAILDGFTITGGKCEWYLSTKPWRRNVQLLRQSYCNQLYLHQKLLAGNGRRNVQLRKLHNDNKLFIY